MRRALALLVLSLLGGVLIAQDRSDSLRDRVRALRQEIESRTRATVPNQMTSRHYDLTALFSRVPTSSLTRRDLPFSVLQPPEEGAEEPWSFWEPDSVLEFVTEAAGPDADLELTAGLLKVSGPPVIHRRVEKLLAALSERARDKFIVEIEIIPGSEDEEMGVPLGRATVRCMNGATHAYSATTERKYVSDYDEESAQEAGLGKAITARISEGLSGDLQICLDRHASGVLAHLRVHWQRLAAEPRTADTQHGPLTLPALDAIHLESSAWLPLDHRVVVASCTRGMTPCHVVVRVRLAE